MVTWSAFTVKGNWKFIIFLFLTQRVEDSNSNDVYFLRVMSNEYKYKYDAQIVEAKAQTPFIVHINLLLMDLIY